jgi:hypothetical protein
MGLPKTQIMLGVALGSSLGSSLANMPSETNTPIKNKGTIGDPYRQIMSTAANTNRTNPTYPSLMPIIRPLLQGTQIWPKDSKPT